MGFDPRSGSAQPNPTQPNPARSGPARPGPTRPWRPHPPCAPSSSLSLSFGSPVQQLPSPSSTSLSPWCPRDLRRRSPEFGPRGELPSPSLSLPLPPLLPRPPHALIFPCSRALLPFPLVGGAAPPRPLPARDGARWPRLAPSLPAAARGGPAPSLPAAATLPSPLAGGTALPSPARGPRPLLPRRGFRPPADRPWRSARPGPCPQRGLGPLRASSWPLAWFAWPWRGLALPRLPLARSRVRKPALAVIIFGW
jgi:hypothetical protein